MVNKSKSRRKVTITEDNMDALLQWYSANTVLTLLREVYHAVGEKFDWHEMVKNTATGISSAREYQMLWRHLSRGETLVHQIDPDENPLDDDDSDLDYEVEAFPALGREETLEAEAVVKVLIGSGCTKNSHLPSSSTIEAPLTLKLPNSRGYVTIPVTLPRVPSCSGLSGEKRPYSEASGVNLPPRKKRRGWSTQEDLKLTTAANKSVEPNWTNIAKEDFNDDRKPSELSQRWANLKRKQGNSKVGNTSQQSETPLAAAHRAVSLAIDMPMGDKSKTNSVGMRPPYQPQKPVAPADQTLASGGPTKSQFPTRRPPANPTPTPDSMVKAAAVAAGARIATEADASSLLEAARSQNVVHITTGGGSTMRSNPTNITSQLPSNVHFLRDGLVKSPISKNVPAKPSIIPQSVEAEPPHVQKSAVASTSGNVIVERVPENQSDALNSIGMKSEKE